MNSFEMEHMPWFGMRRDHQQRAMQHMRRMHMAPFAGHGPHFGHGEVPDQFEGRGHHFGHHKGPFGFGGRRHHEEYGEGPGRFAQEQRGRHRGHGGPGGEGPWGGHRGRGGRRGVGRGDVRAAILVLLSEQASHGYQLIQSVSERSGGLWQPSPGSVYPALQLLGDEGLILAEESEGRRVFHLTESGQAYVQAHWAELDTAWKAMTENTDQRGPELHGLLQQMVLAVRQVAQQGTSSQIASARELLANTRRQLYRILSEDDTDAPKS